MNFKKRYRDLEMEVLSALGLLVTNSTEKSEDYNTPILKVDINGFVELGIIDGRLMLIDENGLQGYILSSCTLEEMIEIVEEYSN